MYKQANSLKAQRAQPKYAGRIKEKNPQPDQAGKRAQKSRKFKILRWALT